MSPFYLGAEAVSFASPNVLSNSFPAHSGATAASFSPASLLLRQKYNSFRSMIKLKVIISLIKCEQRQNRKANPQTNKQTNKFFERVAAAPVLLKGTPSMPPPESRKSQESL